MLQANQVVTHASPLLLGEDHPEMGVQDSQPRFNLVRGGSGIRRNETERHQCFQRTTLRLAAIYEVDNVREFWRRTDSGVMEIGDKKKNLKSSHCWEPRIGEQTATF
jgi:hypothetical protein